MWMRTWSWLFYYIISSTTAKANVTVTNNYVVAGETAHVVCSTTQNATLLHFMWYFNDELKLTATTSAMNSTFTISGVGVTDAGGYRCVVMEDGLGTTETEHWALYIQLPGLEWIVKRSRIGPLYWGTALSVSCIGLLTTSKGIDVVVAIRNQFNQTIPASADNGRVGTNFSYTLVPPRYVTRLYIASLNPSDDGVYTCQGDVSPTSPSPYINQSTTSVSFNINTSVSPSPSQPFNIRIATATPDIIIVIWDTANPRSLQTYRVEYTPTHWNNQTVSIYVNDTSVNISDFYLNTTYSIVVEAINEHGTSRSNVSYFITPYEDPRVNVSTYISLIPDTTPLYMGLNLELVCSIRVQERLGQIRSVDIVTQWQRSGRPLTNNNSLNTILPVRRLDDYNYKTAVVFNSLNTNRDEGNYSCDVMLALYYHNLPRVLWNSSINYSLEIPTITVQILLSGISDCDDWRVSNQLNKANDISAAMVEQVSRVCQCDFSDDRLTDRVFLCNEFQSNSVLYQVTLHGAKSVTATEVSTILTSWSSSDISVPVQLELLIVEKVCELPVSSNNSSCTPDKAKPLDIAALFIGFTVVIAVLLLLLILGICYGVIMYQRRLIHKKNKYLSNHTGTPSTVEVSEPHYEEITHRSKEGEAPEIILNDCPAYSRKPTLVDSLSYCVAYTDRETVTEEIECSTCPAYSNPLHTCQEDSHSI